MRAPAIASRTSTVAVTRASRPAAVARAAGSTSPIIPAPERGDAKRVRSMARKVYPPRIEGSSASAELRLRSADLRWQAVEDDVLVLDLRNDLYLEVNRSGALLWELLARGTSRTE